MDIMGKQAHVTQISLAGISRAASILALCCSTSVLFLGGKLCVRGSSMGAAGGHPSSQIEFNAHAFNRRHICWLLVFSQVLSRVRNNWMLPFSFPEDPRPGKGDRGRRGESADPCSDSTQPTHGSCGESGVSQRQFSL